MTVTPSATVDARTLGAVIFDIDGALLDSVDAYAQALAGRVPRLRLRYPVDRPASGIRRSATSCCRCFWPGRKSRHGGRRSGALLKANFLPRFMPFPQAAARAGLRTVGVPCNRVDEANLRDAGCITVPSRSGGSPGQLRCLATEAILIDVSRSPTMEPGHATGSRGPRAPAAASASTSSRVRPASRSTACVCSPCSGAPMRTYCGVAEKRAAGRAWRMRPAAG